MTSLHFTLMFLCCCCFLGAWAFNHPKHKIYPKNSFIKEKILFKPNGVQAKVAKSESCLFALNKIDRPERVQEYKDRFQDVEVKAQQLEAVIESLDLKGLFNAALDVVVISIPFILGLSYAVQYASTIYRGWTLLEMAAQLPGHSLQVYTASIQNSPTLTAIATSTTSYFLGDVLAQVITEDARPGRFDKARGLRWGAAGACVHATLSQAYFPISDIIAEHLCGVGASWQKIFFQIWFDNTIYFPILTLALFAFLAVTSGETLASSWTSFEKKLVPLGTRAWRFWPVADLLTFGPVPPALRLLYVSTIRILWVAIQSSYIAGQKKIEKELAENPNSALVAEPTTKQFNKSSLGNIQFPPADSPEMFYAFSIYFLVSFFGCLFILVNP